MWAVGLRSGSSLEDVRQAYRSGRIVRSWPLRGTIHVTPAEDAGWLGEVTSARTLGAAAERRRARIGLRPRDIELVREAVVQILRGCRALRREALLAEVATRGVRLENHWKYHLIWFLTQTGTLLFGPVEDGRHLLVLASEWVRAPRRLGREEALTELAARYVASHGPAKADDLAWWAGLGKRQAAEALTLAGDKVVSVNCDDGAEYWIDPAAAEGTARPGVVLLPAFDEHLLGYRDRALSLDPAHASAVCPGGNGVFKPVVVADGLCVGTWRAPAPGALRKRPAEQPVPLTVTWFDKDARRAPDAARLAAAANRYARYLGRESATVTVG
jgi:hypothetical protein